jgi:hypothetical protein
MEDRSRRLREPLTWGRRERAAVAALVTVVVLAVAALVAFAATSGSPARKDCIEVTFASSVGAASEHACGARARAICASPQPFRSSAQQLRESCDRAGFRYGS